MALLFDRRAYSGSSTQGVTRLSQSISRCPLPPFSLGFERKDEASALEISIIREAWPPLRERRRSARARARTLELLLDQLQGEC